MELELEWEILLGGGAMVGRLRREESERRTTEANVFVSSLEGGPAGGTVRFGSDLPLRGGGCQ